MISLITARPACLRTVERRLIDRLEVALHRNAIARALDFFRDRSGYGSFRRSDPSRNILVLYRLSIPYLTTFDK